MRQVNATKTALKLLLSVVFCAATTCAFSQGVSVGVSCSIVDGYSSPTGFPCQSQYLANGTSPSWYDKSYIPNSVVSTSGNIDISEPATANNSDFKYVNGSTSASGRAEFGNIGIRLSSSISGISNTNNGSNYTISTNASADFIDRATVRAASPGAASQLQINGYFDIANTEFYSDARNIGFYGGTFNITLNVFAGDSTFVAKLTPAWDGDWQGPKLVTGRNYFSISTTVADGASINFGASISGNLQTINAPFLLFPQNNFTPKTSIESGSIDAFNSLHLYLVAEPGTIVTTQSGSTYAAAVPEPSSYVLALCGFGAVCISLKKRPRAISNGAVAWPN
jgi:hypothetical protein